MGKESEPNDPHPPRGKDSPRDLYRRPVGLGTIKVTRLTIKVRDPQHAH